MAALWPSFTRASGEGAQFIQANPIARKIAKSKRASGDLQRASTRVRGLAPGSRVHECAPFRRLQRQSCEQLRVYYNT